MKLKRFVALFVVAAMMTIALPVFNVQAAEIALFDWQIDNDYAGHGIETNWQGQAMNMCPGYADGEKWATAWGGKGWYTDAEDGSLAFTTNTEKKSNEESYLGRRIVADTLTDNSELILTLKFRTAPQPKASAGEIWFVLNSQESTKANETQANTFMIKNSMTGDMEHGFASSTSWPFTKKIPDRDPNNVTFDYDKDYEVEITLKPATEDAYRYVAKIKENGTDKGTVIINEWPGFKPSQVKKPVQLTIATINRSDPRECEPIIYLKGISMKAKLADKPLNCEFVPADGSRDVPLDTKFSAEFEKPVEEILPEQVSVSGGAVVEGVSMVDSKLNIELSNLAPKTSYTINITDVKAVVGDSAYDYSWSFTTDSGITFSKPYYSLIDEKLIINSFDDFNPVPVSNDEYINGAWGSAYLENDGKLSQRNVDYSKVSDEFCVEEEYLWAYIHNQGASAEDRTASKHFEPIGDGDILNLSAVVRFNYPTKTHDSTHYTGASVEISGDNGNLALIQYGVSPWRQTVRFLNDGGANYFAQDYKNTAVTTTGQFRWIYEPKQLNGNDLFYNHGSNNADYIYAFPNRAGDITALDGDITLTLTAKPSETDSSKYDLTLVTAGPNIDAVSTRTVDKELILGLSDFHLVSSRSSTKHTVPVEKLIGLKSVSITAPLGGLLPEVGESNIYIDYENITETPSSAEILVVEKDSVSNEILSIHLENFTGLTGSGMIQVPVELEMEGSVLEIYMLNNAGGMILLAEPEFVNVASE